MQKTTYNITTKRYNIYNNYTSAVHRFSIYFIFFLSHICVAAQIVWKCFIGIAGSVDVRVLALDVSGVNLC